MMSAGLYRSRQLLPPVCHTVYVCHDLLGSNGAAVQRDQQRQPKRCGSVGLILRLGLTAQRVLAIGRGAVSLGRRGGTTAHRPTASPAAWTRLGAGFG